MATTHFTTPPSVRTAHSPSLTRGTVGGVLLAGMVAGMMFGMLQMIVEAVIGQGFWSPLRYIASVFTLGSNTDPSFAIGPVIVGLGGHMMNSIVLGAVFAALVWKLLRNPVALAMAGMMWGAILFVVTWWAVLPTIDPAMRLVNGPWFFVSHLVYGMVLGLGLAVVRRVSQARQPAPA
ncbi:MAG: hypothetical protein ACYDAC_07220 [Candidatus Dormibacteria bacterium]